MSLKPFETYARPLAASSIVLALYVLIVGKDSYLQQIFGTEADLNRRLAVFFGTECIDQGVVPNLSVWGGDHRPGSGRSYNGALRFAPREQNRSPVTLPLERFH